MNQSGPAQCQIGEPFMPAFCSETAEHWRFLARWPRQAENFCNLGRQLAGSPPATGGY
ncbi:hypothetical protein V1283_002062 [Bradyrhizobium sp. AZCC 2262]